MWSPIQHQLLEWVWRRLFASVITKAISNHIWTFICNITFYYAHEKWNLFFNLLNLVTVLNYKMQWKWHCVTSSLGWRYHTAPAFVLWSTATLCRKVKAGHRKVRDYIENQSTASINYQIIANTQNHELINCY